MQNESPDQPRSTTTNDDFPGIELTIINLGGRIRMARLRRNLSAKDVAMSAGISVPTLRQLERGRPTVSVGIVARVLHFLNLLSTLNAVALDTAFAHIPPTLRKRAPRKSASREFQSN
jgi:transcriptional regulator with XRE-family HTH domain